MRFKTRNLPYSNPLCVIKKMNKMKIYLLFLTLITLSCTAQKNNYDNLLRELDINNQLKLDTGKFMLGTEREYAMKLDSLMKVIYNDLFDLKKIKRENLVTEQNEWNLQNKLKIKNIWETLEKSNNELGIIPNDEKMFAYQEQAELTRKRILELIDKFND